MDWNTLLIASIPALITGIISYFSASKKAKIELDKSKINQEVALKTIETNQKLAIETIEKNAQNEIEKMRTATREEIQLYNAKSKTDIESAEQQMLREHTMPFVASMIGNLFSGDSTPKEIEDKIKGLTDLSESIKKRR